MSSPQPERVNSFDQDLKRRYGARVHKPAINTGFTCPNRDGSKGCGSCTFCSNVSFSPNARQHPDVAAQIAAGHDVWLELGLQSAFDDTLARVNRSHGFSEYNEAVQAARRRGLKVCTHLIVGMLGDDAAHVREVLATTSHTKVNQPWNSSARLAISRH